SLTHWDKVIKFVRDPAPFVEHFCDAEGHNDPLCCASLLAWQRPRVEAQQDTNDTCPGVIEAKLSIGRRIALDAPVELLLRPTPKNNHVDPVMVTFDPAPDFSVEPPAIRLEQSPNQSQQVRIVLKGPNP